MEQQDILKLIKTKNTWTSDELIEMIKSEDNKIIKIKFCYIGGYECLRDGTKTEICKSLVDVQELLDEYDISYDHTINNAWVLAKSISSKWNKIHNDGGGSGWIE